MQAIETNCRNCNQVIYVYPNQYPLCLECYYAVEQAKQKRIEVSAPRLFRACKDMLDELSKSSIQSPNIQRVRDILKEVEQP